MHIRTLSVLSIVAAIAAANAAPAAAGQIFVEGTRVTTGGDPVTLGPRGGQVKTGTGRIAGRVVSADTGTPIRRAQVRLTGPDIGVKTSMTDAEGRFDFRDLPAGRFTVNVSKAGYVSIQYGQTRAFESGRAIELADKQVMDKADIAMPRGGVISGRIVDELGEPVVEAAVTAMRQNWSAGRRRLASAGRVAQTNDLGQFRIYGLPPGEYYVSASIRNSSEMVMVDAALATRLNMPAPPDTPAASGYAPTYFPGTTSPANAQRVTVGVGQEAQNTDFALTAVRLARISGTVMSSEGRPLEGAMVSANPTGPGHESPLSVLTNTTGRTDRNGAFTITGAVPGDYLLNVRTIRIVTSSSPGGNQMSFTTTIGGPNADSETALMPVTVAGDDLSNVLIVTSKGLTATGKVVFEGGSAPPRSSPLMVMQMTDDGDMGLTSTAPVTPEGTFELKGLLGRRTIRLSGLPRGWVMKSVRANGEDITDGAYDFRPGSDVPSLEIVASPNVTEIAGTVAAANGSAIKDYTVVVFSTDSQHWQPLSRRVTGMRPNQEGRFEIRGLPPGSYYVAAVDYIEQGAWGDPDMLERIKLRASQFTLAEGATETLSLKLVEQY